MSMITPPLALRSTVPVEPWLSLGPLAASQRMNFSTPTSMIAAAFLLAGCNQRGINGTTVKLTLQPSLAATSQVVTLRRISSMESRRMLSR